MTWRAISGRPYDVADAGVGVLAGLLHPLRGRAGPPQILLATPRHRYLFNSRNEGSKCVSVTWWELPHCPYSAVCATQLGLAVADLPPVEVNGAAAQILLAISSTPNKHHNPHLFSSGQPKWISGSEQQFGLIHGGAGGVWDRQVDLNRMSKMTPDVTPQLNSNPKPGKDRVVWTN